MRCEEYQRRLSAYLDGECAAADARALEQHLRQCEVCAMEFSLLRGTARLLRALEMEEPPAELKPRIMAALAATRPSPWSRLALLSSPARRPGWSLAATSAALALLVGLVGYRLIPASAPSMRPAPPAQLATAPAPESVETTGEPGVSDAARQPAPIERRASNREKQSSATEPRVAASAPTAARPAAQPAKPARPLIATVPRTTERTPRRPGQARLIVGETPGDQSGPVRATGMGLKPPLRRPGPPAPVIAGVSESPEATPPGELPQAPGTPTPESEVKEPTTVMASASTGSGTGSHGSPGNDDALSSLRRRLAEERRELPPLELPETRRNAQLLPVRIEF